jgi:hypothetical protein
MKWHYDLTGAEQIYRDVPVYHATSLSDGEGLMMTSQSSTTDGEFTAWSNGANAAVNSLGMCCEAKTTTSKAGFGDHISTAATATTDAIGSIASTIATGNIYAKAIINPFAVYLAEYSQLAASYCTAAADSASTTYTQTVEEKMEGGWLYVVPGVTSSIVANQGQLRYIAVSTSTTSYTLLTAMTTTTAEKLISIKPVNHRLVGLNASATNTATMLSNLTSMAAQATLSLHVIENYVGGKNKPLEPMRQQVHDGIADTTLKFYSDLVQLDHCYVHV